MPRSPSTPALALCLALVSVGLPALAQAPNPGSPGEATSTFYSTATVVEKPLDQTTTTVTVLDRTAIEASGTAGVAELLRGVPGLFLESNGTRGGLTVARLRGGDPNYTLVLLDGVPLNDGTYQIGDVFDLEALPTAAVERIEIIRGPISAFYGSSGLAGAIHIFTRQGTPGSPRGEVAATVGNADLRRLETTFSAARNRSRWFLALTGDREDRRIAEERFDSLQAQGRLDHGWGRNTSLTVTTRIADWQADDYPDASGGPLFGSGELRSSQHREVSLGGELSWEAPTDGVHHRLSLGTYSHTLDRHSPAIVPLVPESVESTRFARYRLGWALAWDPAPGLRVSGGATVEQEQGSNRSTLLLPAELGGEISGDYSLTRTTPGLFAETSWGKGPWQLELGSRFDHLEGGTSKLSPRFGIAYRPRGASWRLRASAGRSFKLPSFFALASPAALGGNPDLRAETMEGFDLGLELPAVGGNLALTFFSHHYRNLVDFDFQAFRHINRGRVVTEGIELEFTHQPLPKLDLAFALTWQDAEDRTSDQTLLHRPDWTGNLRVHWRPSSEIDLHLDWSWTGRRFDSQLPVPEIDTIASTSLNGFGARWRASARLSLEAQVDNLLDRRYQTLIGFPGAGRSLRLGLRWRVGRGE